MQSDPEIADLSGMMLNIFGHCFCFLAIKDRGKVTASALVPAMMLKDREKKLESDFDPNRQEEAGTGNSVAITPIGGWLGTGNLEVARCFISPSQQEVFLKTKPCGPGTFNAL